MPVALPDELLERTADRKTVLFAGAGMSMPKLPGWADLLHEALGWAGREQIDIPEVEDVLQLIDDGDLLLAAQEIRGALADANFCRFLRQRFRDEALAPSETHRLLPKLPFAAVLTTNYDKLIEQAYPAGTACQTPRDFSELSSIGREDRFAIVKVHGDVDQCATVVLGKNDYRGAMFANEGFRRFLEHLAYAKTFLFLGCSLTDPDVLAVLERLKFGSGGFAGPHFALMRTHGVNRRKRRDFENSYGIRILGDPDRADFPDIHSFLIELKERLPQRTTPQPAPAPPKPTVPEEEAEDIRQLLEAMGHRVRDMQLSDDCAHFLGNYRARDPSVRNC